MSDVLIIGAQNIDIFAKSNSDYSLHDSNLAKIHIAFGGVGRNIAENLCRLEHDVHFITVFGDDYFSLSAYRSLEEMGIDVSESLKIKNESNSVYLGVMDKDNDLFIGLNDMEITNKLNKEFFETKKKFINKFDVIVIDNNLSEETLHYLLSTYQDKTIVMDAVSAHKVVKLKNHLSYISVLKLNQIELNELTMETAVINQIDELHLKGANTLLITNQDKDIILSKKEKREVITPLKHDNIVNATGAGDAFLSGYVHGMLKGVTDMEKLKFAVKVAYITLSSNNSTSELLNIEEVNKL